MAMAARQLRMIRVSKLQSEGMRDGVDHVLQLRVDNVEFTRASIHSFQQQLLHLATLPLSVNTDMLTGSAPSHPLPRCASPRLLFLLLLLLLLLLATSSEAAVEVSEAPFLPAPLQPLVRPPPPSPAPPRHDNSVVLLRRPSHPLRLLSPPIRNCIHVPSNLPTALELPKPAPPFLVKKKTINPLLPSGGAAPCRPSELLFAAAAAAHIDAGPPSNLDHKTPNPNH
jgi:hypothetical protein